MFTACLESVWSPETLSQGSDRKGRVLGLSLFIHPLVSVDKVSTLIIAISSSGVIIASCLVSAVNAVGI